MATNKEGCEYANGRRKTFTNWSSNAISSEELADAGFIYKGSGDEVVCVFCTKRLSHWQEGDSAAKEHRKLSETCRFVTEPEKCEGDPTVVKIPCGTTQTDADVWCPPDYGDTELGPCLACKETKSNVLLQPCMEVVLCEPCAKEKDTCPKCNTTITGRIPVQPQN